MGTKGWKNLVANFQTTNILTWDFMVIWKIKNICMEKRFFHTNPLMFLNFQTSIKSPTYFSWQVSAKSLLYLASMQALHVYDARSIACLWCNIIIQWFWTHYVPMTLDIIVRDLVNVHLFLTKYEITWLTLVWILNYLLSWFKFFVFRFCPWAFHCACSGSGVKENGQGQRVTYRCSSFMWRIGRRYFSNW